MTNIQNEFSTAVAAAISSLCSDLVKTVAKQVKGFAADQADKLLAELEWGFKRYTDRNFERYSKVKTLLHRYEPIDIRNAYVPSNLMIGKSKATPDQVVDSLKSCKRIVVTGIAGSGKSMLLRHAFISMCKPPIISIPIFIEMRSLNTGPDKTFLQHLHENISAIVRTFTQSQLEYCLTNGKFALILDGIDEIDYHYRDNICDQILQISYRYPLTPILASSRPHDRFISWNEFHTALIYPLDKTQVLELLAKIEYEPEIKEKFISEIELRLFESHGSFLSNPLLCTMMLLTYEEFAEIPAKIHVFYEQAFNVLYNKHDATKSSFRRTFYTSLSIDDFRRLFSAMCVFSYLDGRLSFTETDARKYITSAARFENLVVDQQMFLNDLQESVCILLLDGDELNFLHRSFQEYFVAVFLALKDDPIITNLIRHINERLSNDQVMSLLIEINREAFETRYFRNEMKALCNIFDQMDVSEEPLPVFELFYDSILVSDDSVVGLSIKQQGIGLARRWNALLRIMHNHYPHLKAQFDFRLPTLSSPYNGPDYIAADGRGEIGRAKITNIFLKETNLAKYLTSIVDLAAMIVHDIDQRAAGRTELLSQLLAKPNSMNH